jgi:hypothetical protein
MFYFIKEKIIIKVIINKMFGNEGLMDKLKSFDVYRKLPKDYLKPTFIGAVRKK